MFEEAEIIYSDGFFITVSPDSMRLASAEAAKRGSTYCLKLAAPFIVMVPPFKAVVIELLPKMVFLFGNETDVQELMLPRLLCSLVKSSLLLQWS